MKKYNHAYAIAFSIDTDHEPDDVTAKEMFAGIYQRLVDLRTNPDEILEACGLPLDSYEHETPRCSRCGAELRPGAETRVFTVDTNCPDCEEKP